MSWLPRQLGSRPFSFFSPPPPPSVEERLEILERAIYTLDVEAGELTKRVKWLENLPGSEEEWERKNE